MFLLVSVRHVGAHPGGHQHGVSLQISINLGKTFLRISRIRNILLTWILARNLLYLPPFISQIPDFIYWTVLIFILIYFESHDTENQQYKHGVVSTIRTLFLLEDATFCASSESCDYDPDPDACSNDCASWLYLRHIITVSAIILT